MNRWFISSLLLIPAFCCAQDRPPIATDRPGFSDGSNVVAPGVLQLEGGFFRTMVGGQSFTSLPDLLIRYGIDKNSEIRLIGLTYGFAPGSNSALLDPSIGFKYRLYQGKGEVTFIGQTAFPIGVNPLRTNRWNPTGKIAWTTPVGKDTLGGNFVLARMGADSSQFTQFAASLFLSHPVTDKFALTPEFWLVDKVARGQSSGSFASIAATYLVDNDTQLDFRIGTAFNQRRDGWFMQGGISYRF